MQFLGEKNWNDVLIESIRRNDVLQTRKSIVTYGASPNCLDNDGNTPLTNAIKTGNRKIIILLLKHEADIFKCGPKGTSPIACAIYRDHLAVVKLLLKKINVNSVDDSGNTPLVYAARSGKVNIVEFLLNNGANVDKFSPLTEAIIAGHLPVVKALVDKGANIDKYGPDGNTSVALAAKHKRTEIVKFLTMAEADLCKVGERGKSALSWAVINEDQETVEFLLENGCRSLIQMALLDAVESGNIEMVNFLVEEGAVVDFVYKGGVTLLTKATEVGKLEIVNYLEERGVVSNKNTVEDLDENSFVKIDITDEFF